MRPPWKWLGTGAAAAGVAVSTALAARTRRRSVVQPASIAGVPEPAPARLELLAPGPALLVATLASATRGFPHGVADVYREARRSFGRAAGEANGEALDELERSSRALWQASSLAEPFVSPDVRRLARRSRRLLDLLAERRELDELLAAARAERDVLGQDALVRLEAVIMRRQARVEGKLVEAGRELYATKASRVAGRLGAGGFTNR